MPGPTSGYFFADYVHREIRYLNPATTRTGWSTFEVLDNSPLDIKVAADGTMHYLTRSNSSLNWITYGTTQLATFEGPTDAADS